MLTALEFINVEQLHKKNSALLSFHLSSAIPDLILNRIGITHLFVDNQYQAFGIGKALLARLMATSHTGEVSLKASLNAVSFYESQGFVAIGSEMSVNGIRFVPMVWQNTHSK